MALDGQIAFTPGDRRRFSRALRNLGITNCLDEIERPDLWVQALELSLNRAGENFQNIYIDLLMGSYVIPS